MNRNHRRGVLAGFAVIASIVVTASAAFACVAFKGDLTVSSPGGNGNTVTGANNGNMDYCSNGHPTTAAAARRGDSITVKVAKGSASLCATTSNKLSNRSHSVMLNNAKTDGDVPFKYDSVLSRWVFQGGTGCFLNPPGNIVLSNAGFPVDTYGNGQASYTLPALNRVDPTNMASALCVGTGSTSEGIFAPVRITSI